MNKEPKQIYSLSWTGNIKEIEVISSTKLPDGKFCYNLKDFGYCIFPKNDILQKGESILCNGFSALKNANKSSIPSYINKMKEDVVFYEKKISEHTAQINEAEKHKAERDAFIEEEELKYIELQKQLNKQQA